MTPVEQPIDAVDPSVPSADRCGSLRRWWPVGALLLAGLLAYANSFTGVFVFDDLPTIIRNETIRGPHWLRALTPPIDTTVSGRPVANLTLALNYAFGRLDPRGYHVVNLLIHLCAGLALFGVVRRTLLLPALRARFADTAPTVAFLVALLWIVHPLQTEAVTYVVQRVESLVGLFYLLTVYAFVRQAQCHLMDDTSGRRRWTVVALATCALGMATKEVMVSAPLFLLLYDRTLVAGSFRAAWRQRWPLYAGFAATWILLGWLVLGSNSRTGTAGLGTASAWQYLLTQCYAIVQYLRLAVVPHPLVFDYGKSLIANPVDVLPRAILIAGLLVATVWAVARKSPWALLGAWFFLILAPSSSFVPVATQTVAEHRMYLPLATVLVVVTLGAVHWFNRRALLLVSMLATVLGGVTIWRNADYHSELRLWQVTVARRPTNPRAQSTLGQTLFNLGQTKEAIACYQEALRLDPDHFEAHNNLGIAFLDAGRLADAYPHFAAAARLRPEYAQVHSNLGMALNSLGKPEEALPFCERAVQLEPTYAEARSNLAVVLNALGRHDAAAAACHEALRLRPNYAEAYANLGLALEGLGQPLAAIEQYEHALKLRPNLRQAHSNLARALQAQGRVPEAIAHYQSAVQISPESAIDQYGLSNALVKLRRWSEAVGPCAEAARLNPDMVEAHTNFGTALFFNQQIDAAVLEFETALRLKPDSLKAHYFLGNVFASVGQAAKAKLHYEEALRLNPNYAPARENLARLAQTDGAP